MGNQWSSSRPLARGKRIPRTGSLAKYKGRSTLADAFGLLGFVRCNFARENVLVENNVVKCVSVTFCVMALTSLTELWIL